MQNESSRAPRVLLINSQGPREASDTPGANIGMGYVAGAFQQHGWDVAYIDEILSHMTPREVADLALAQGPFDVIGLHVLTRFIPHVADVLKELRRHFPDTRILIGGPFPSTFPDLSLRMLAEVDAALEGEIEGAFPALGEYLQGKMPASDVPGLWTRGEGEEIVKGLPRLFPDLSNVPVPAWDVVHPDFYFDIPGSKFHAARRAVATIFTRGCPYYCTYCSAHCITGRKVRCRPIPQIIEELRFLKTRYGAGEIICMDDGLTVNRNFILEVCRAIRDADLDLVFSAPYGVRLDSLDEEVLAAMESAGFYMIAVGIEAGNQARLDRIRKHLTLETIRTKTQLVKRCTRMSVTGLLILGYPDETIQEARATIRLACELPLDRAIFFSCCLLPGTELYDEAVSKGLLRAQDFESRSVLVPGRTFAQYSTRRLHQLVIEAYLRFYLHPRRLISLMRNLKGIGQYKRFAECAWEIIRG